MAGRLTETRARGLIHMLRTAMQEIHEIATGNDGESGGLDFSTRVDRIEEIAASALFEEDEATKGGELLFE